jgi:hypothetical protein
MEPMKVGGVTAKFQVKSVNQVFWGTGAKPHIIQLEAVTSGPGNESWSQYTPSGKMEMTVTNPAAAGFFTPGKTVFINFTEADA